MLKIIRNILQQFIDNIDAGNSNLTCEQQCDIIRVLIDIKEQEKNEMSKTQAADYIGVSRATFDNYVHDGFIPKGTKVEGFKELRWYKSDLDIFLTQHHK